MYRDSRWQQKRLEIMERDGWTCRSCGKSGEGISLNVHHAYYEPGKKPWEYDNEMLFTYCDKCHEFRHRVQKDLLLSFANLPRGLVLPASWILCPGYRPVLEQICPDLHREYAAIAMRSVYDAYQQGYHDASQDQSKNGGDA
jgi:hypothetical protein